MNHDSRAETALRQTLHEAIARGVFPGAALCWRREGQTLAEINVGKLGASDSADVSKNTLYDLASLSKIYLLGAALRELRSRKIALETPVSRFFPQFDNSIQIADLMRHSSGLRRHLQTLHTAPTATWLDALASAPLHSKTVFYNCSNSFVLGRVLVQIAGEKLDEIVARTVFRPANLTASFEVPNPREILAPTEISGENATPVGEVHDEAARAFRRETDDFAGNAGVFASARDVAKFGDLWRRETAFFAPEDWVAIARNALPENQNLRGLGWQIGARFCVGNGPFSGEIWSHLGFTGPLLAVHPRSQTVLALLCNRVFPTRNGPDRLPFFRRICEICFAP